MWRNIIDQLLLPASKEPPKALSAGQAADLRTLQLLLQQFDVWTHSRFPTSSQRPHFRSLSTYRLSQQQHGVLPNKLLPISIFSPKEEEGCWQPHCRTCYSTVLSCVSAQFLYSHLLPGTGKGRREAKGAPRQVGTAVWKMWSAGNRACRARETDSKGMVLYYSPEVKSTSHISTSCSSPHYPWWPSQGWKPTYLQCVEKEILWGRDLF